MDYKHGGDIYRNRTEYDFSVNINPLGMPEAAFESLADNLDIVCNYPDYQGEKLRTVLSKYYEVEPSKIALFNGAAELIYLIAAYAGVKYGKGYRALVTAPSFSEYEDAVISYGGNMDSYYLEAQNNFDMDDGIFDAIRKDTRLVFICNPNNPTGRVTERKILEELARKCRENNTLLVVDESFIQFLSNEKEITMVNCIKNYDNVLIIQSFTKIFGMPGLRLGCGICRDEHLLDKIRNMSQPWNTSALAQLAGEKAVEDYAFIQKTRELIDRERDYLTTEMNKGLVKEIIPGSANYILFRADKPLYERLMKQGIMIRRCNNFKGLSDDYFRIGIKSHEDNAELIKRWRDEYGYT